MLSQRDQWLRRIVSQLVKGTKDLLSLVIISVVQVVSAAYSSQSSSTIAHLICQYSQLEYTRFHLTTPERCDGSPKGDG